MVTRTTQRFFVTHNDKLNERNFIMFIQNWSAIHFLSAENKCFWFSPNGSGILSRSHFCGDLERYNGQWDEQSGMQKIAAPRRKNELALASLVYAVLMRRFSFF